MEINLKNKIKTLVNINKLFNGRNDPIKIVDGYASIILEAKRKTAEEEPEPVPSKAKTKRKNSPLELREEFINKIENEEKNINEQIFKEYFYDHIPLFLAKELYSNNQTINDEIVKNINGALIKLKKDINRKNIPENENLEKILLKKFSILTTNQKVKDVHVCQLCVLQT